MKLHHFLLLLAVAALCWLGLTHVRKALPPDVVVIETGPVGGTYHRNAERYAELMRAKGFNVELRPNPDSLTIVDHVSRRENGAVIGFTGQEIDTVRTPDAVSVAVVEFQPLFLFYDIALGRMGSPVNLKGRRIVMPFEDSATSKAALDLLGLYGITRENSDITFLPIGEAAAALQSGRADAGFFMLAAEHPLVQTLSADQELAIYSYHEAHSISINLRYLGIASIPIGAFDLAKLLPPEPLDVIGAPINVVVHRDLHPAVVYALIEALQKVHGGRTAVSEAGQYPSFTATALPLHDSAQTFSSNGRPWAHRVFSSTLASLVDEFFVLALALFLTTEAYKTIKYANELFELLLGSALLGLVSRLDARRQAGHPLRWPGRLILRLARRLAQKSSAEKKLKETVARLEGTA